MFARANLSGDYFTNRQDRYMEFLAHPPLANYFHNLLKTVASYSYRALASDTSTPHPQMNIVWPDNNPAASPIDTPALIPDLKLSAHESFTTLTRHWASQPLSSLSAPLPPSNTPHNAFDTSVRPVLQMGPFNISQETDIVVPAIFRTANSLATAPGGSLTTIDWTSGYFSVQERYKELVLDSKANVRIVAASPEVRRVLMHFAFVRFVPC